VETMTNLHRLRECRLCETRMAVPGENVCTICDAVTIPAMVEELMVHLYPGQSTPEPAVGGS